MIQSLERAFAILEILDMADPREGTRVSTLSKKLDLKMPTVHNLLKTLAELGYVKQGEDSTRYFLGSKAENLGKSADKEKSLSEIGEYFVRRINEETDESVVLAFYANSIWYSLLHLNSSQLLNARVRTNYTGNLYISATGRSILSILPQDELRAYINRQGLPGDDWNGISSKEELFKAIDKIRSESCSFYTKNDAVSLAVPVYSRRRSIYAALGVYLPETRFTRENREKILSCLNENGKALTELLEN